MITCNVCYGQDPYCKICSGQSDREPDELIRGRERIEELERIVHKYQSDHGLMDYGFACDCSCEICKQAKVILAR